MKNNPLLMPFLLPPFSKIKLKHMIPALNKLIFNCQEAVKKAIKKKAPHTWENLYQPIIEADDILKRVTSTITHLSSVKNNQELREIHEKMLLLLSKYRAWMNHNKDLYNAYFDLRNGEYYVNLNVEQKRAINNILRDFKLSGISLTKKKQQQYVKITVRLSELSCQYNNNLLDATMGWKKLVFNKEELSGIPEHTLSIARINAKEKGYDGWLLTLDAPSYTSIITYCDNQALRKEIYHAYNTRASDQGINTQKWDNSSVMNEILLLRRELAKLLGFENYVHKSLETKTIKNPQQILNFLIDLSNLVRSNAEKDLKQLLVFIKTEFNVDNVHPWDIAYYSEKQKQNLYGINNEQLRLYFPENQVINGLFEIIKRIYGITVQERNDVDIWNSDVRFFELYDEKNELRGGFYLDLYARKNKRDGAWMDECVCRMRKSDGSLQKPVAYIVCNFTCPINNKLSFFTHKEIVTLFHEFGHGLHHILTCVEVAEVSGINGVPWDAVEFPSQFMENWCWEPDVLTFISSHYKTGKQLPKKLLDNILMIKNYQIAMFILRQVEFSLFDFYLHDKFGQDHGLNILEIMTEVKKQTAVIPDPDWSRFPHAFSHIFSGDYAAGYYGYLLANILAADAYSFFKEEGIFNRVIGQLFLDNILTRGGSENPIKLFKRFRGREPKINSMLEYYGINDLSPNKDLLLFC